MNKRHYEHTLPNIRGSLSNTYLFHAFLLLNDVLEIATNGSGFLCGEQSKVVSVYRNITLLSL